MPHHRLAVLAATLTGAAALGVATPAYAVPTCPGADRSTCGGRIIPEATSSAGFLTYDEWTQAMRTLQAEHPDRVRFEQIGTTAGNHPLYHVLVTDFAAPGPLSSRVGMYFNGDIHGDERDGTEGFARVIEDLAESHDAGVEAKLRREVLVFTDANPDGWVSGDVPAGATDPAEPSGPQFTRQNAAGHDLNREWPVTGFQDPTTNPSVDPEVRSIVQADGNLLHRRDGITFLYGFDVHGSAGLETPPNSQLMLDVLLSAGQFDLTRSLLQTQLMSTYMRNLAATTSDNVLASAGAATGGKAYTVGDWDTSWDIYGYLVSGGFADWMANADTGLGAATGTIELWLNGEPGQENTFAGYNGQIEASNVHSMRVAVQTAMDLASTPQQARLDLAGPVAYVSDRAKLAAGDGSGSTTPVGDPATRPPSRPYPASPERFFSDLAGVASAPVVRLDAAAVSGAAQLAGYRAVVVSGDAHLDSPGLLAALTSYARSGGTVVLTDGALADLPSLTGISAGSVTQHKVYAGYLDATDRSDPLVKGIRTLSRQTYEPVPVGYPITNSFTAATSVNTSPVWTVAQSAWEGAGGRTVGTTGSGLVSLGELPLGAGKVRILGALLPPPSGDAAHPFGVNDYAVTYWGYQVFANLLDGTQRLAPAGGSGGTPTAAVPEARFPLALPLAALAAVGLVTVRRRRSRRSSSA